MTKSLVFKLECSDRGNYCVCQFDPHSYVLCHMLIAKSFFVTNILYHVYAYSVEQKLYSWFLNKAYVKWFIL